MDAHEIWAAAQLTPGEGIEDGVARIQVIIDAEAEVGAQQLEKQKKLAAILLAALKGVSDTMRVGDRFSDAGEGVLAALGKAIEVEQQP